MTPELKEIRPYNRVLAVYEYKVTEVVAGVYTAPTILVAHWTMLDGQRLPVERWAEGKAAELLVEALADHPQLESEYQANDFPVDRALYVDVGD